MKPVWFVWDIMSQWVLSTFQSSYGHPSVLVMELFLKRCSADSTWSSLRFQFSAKWSGSASFWSSRITSRTTSVAMWSSSRSRVPGSASWSLSWYLLASSTMHLELCSYCGGLEPRILRHHMRSLSLLSLLSADHVPPSFCHGL